ncbi:MAG: hypothetical protein A2381_07050 [Bdellovibrionales bacterium RIFOXYB1_FULL_37_110]|nr:MAG: hypothetical protein A2417_14925 [Bdellovibrionales bacterium RIFOXYC1_FULL_37_79]OFZ57819.1 MAG: hypothetical protein A2381_07050 [Bdellovibrionales bacterium RIFOXYB1_FULL_37_110]OFZ62785.1 MAG: hypothetical protein A2577_16570 [Bdellovibrionales bacterium RIFOXYD1_FULL_36_51]
MSWEIYYKKFYNKPPSPLLKIALTNNFYKNGVAYDVGCGTGSDTRFLLTKKWNVLAIDREDMAMVTLKKDLSKFKGLNCLKEDFTKLVFQSSELIHGTYSFGFAGEEGFDLLWQKMVESLKTGGTLSGELFGDQDDWKNSTRVKTIGHLELTKLIKGFDIMYFDEEHFHRPTALGDVKKWHVYSLVLKKR